MYWTTGNLSWNKTHPPLQKYISALPLLMKSIVILPGLNPKTLDEWHMGYQLLFGKGNKALSLIQWMRAPSILVTVLLGLFIFLWGFKWNGWETGLFAMGMIVFDPLMLGNGFLAMNDIFVTFFFAVALFLFLKTMKGSFPALFGCALATAFCITSKFSGLLLLPTFLLLLFIKKKAWKNQNMKWRIKTLSIFIGLTLAVILTLYKFNFSILMEGLAQGRNIQGATGQTGFLHGSIPGSWTWLYYPVAMAIKTPLPLLLLWVSSLIVLYKKGNFKNYYPFLVPIGLFWGAALITPNHFGVRYLLPTIPLLALIVGLAFSSLSPKGKMFFLLLLSGMMIEVGINHPHHMAYFNQFIGGPKQGFRWLDGSNQDWGQDLPSLKKMLDKEGDVSLLLSYQGSNDPRAWGIEYQDVFSPALVSRYNKSQTNPVDTKKEWLAISSNIRAHPQYESFFSWLDKSEQVGWAGNTILVYDLTNDVEAAFALARFYASTGRKILAQRQAKRALFLKTGNF